MIQGLLGKKVGMSQVFRVDGIVVPVTVVEAGPCVVTQIKTQDTDGYEAVQLGFGEVKKRNKPMTGHFNKSLISRYVKEVETDDIGEYQVGQRLTVDVFPKTPPKWFTACCPWGRLSPTLRLCVPSPRAELLFPWNLSITSRSLKTC